VTFPQATDLLIKPVNVGLFDGVDQYLSLPTESSVEVGTGSFVASIWFKAIDNQAGNAEMIGYGETAGSGYRLRFNSAGLLEGRINDGVTGVATPLIDAGMLDGKWHLASLFVDRDPTVNLMTVFLDGIPVGSADISTVTGSLDSPTGLSLGAINAVAQNFYNGQLANFSLYKTADYNLLALLNAGIRESAANGTQTIASNVNTRLNNQITMTANFQYSTSVINTSEGIYDLLELFRSSSAGGFQEYLIDDILISTTNHFFPSNIFNNKNVTSGIFLSAGTHILKRRTNGNDGGSSGFSTRMQMIELIKREGSSTDGDSTSGILFGDEINQVSNLAWTFQANNSRTYLSQVTDLGVGADGQFMEGTLFLKKGLYKVTLTYAQASTRGLYTVTFGGVKVFDRLVATGATIEIAQATRYAFLEGGQTPVRFTVNNNGGNTNADWQNIRYELVTGRSEGDDVEIFYADDDRQTVSGNTPDISINTSSRFNGFMQLTGANSALNDEVIWNRYFSGGTYKVKFLYVQDTNTGVVDVFSDSTIIFDNLDLGTTTVFNQEALTTVIIPRGFHNVGYRVVGTSTANHRVPLQRLQFTLIEPLVDSVNDDNSVTYIMESSWNYYSS